MGSWDGEQPRPTSASPRSKPTIHPPRTQGSRSTNPRMGRIQPSGSAYRISIRYRGGTALRTRRSSIRRSLLGQSPTRDPSPLRVVGSRRLRRKGSGAGPRSRRSGCTAIRHRPNPVDRSTPGSTSRKTWRLSNRTIKARGSERTTQLEHYAE
jgi:hypothetical protein